MRASPYDLGVSTYIGDSIRGASYEPQYRGASVCRSLNIEQPREKYAEASTGERRRGQHKPAQGQEAGWGAERATIEELLRIITNY